MDKPNNLLESEVREELDWDPILDDTRIVVKAQDGRVTLTGSVYTYDESVLASEDAWSVGGVGDVSNDLLVGLVGAALADADVAAACVVALDADRVVPKGAVTPVVVDGWVTLSAKSVTTSSGRRRSTR
jgi:hypothetical protein